MKTHTPPPSLTAPASAPAQTGLFKLDDFGIGPIVLPVEILEDVARANDQTGLEDRSDGIPLAIEQYRSVPAMVEESARTSTRTTLPVESIIEDLAFRARVHLTENTIADYVDHLRNGIELPPVSVVELEGGRHILVDGWHRLEAHRRFGQDVIDATITHGDRTDALKLAATANTTHGLPRTHADKRRAITMLLEIPRFASLSNRTIGTMVCTDHQTVAAVREQLEADGLIHEQKIRMSRNGKKHTVQQAVGVDAAAKGVSRPSWWHPSTSSTPAKLGTATNGLSTAETPEPTEEIYSPAEAAYKSSNLETYETAELSPLTSAEFESADVEASVNSSREQGLMNWLHQKVGADFHMQFDWSNNKVRVQITTQTATYDTDFLEPEPDLDAQIYRACTQMIGAQKPRQDLK